MTHRARENSGLPPIPFRPLGRRETVGVLLSMAALWALLIVDPYLAGVIRERLSPARGVLEILVETGDGLWQGIGALILYTAGVLAGHPAIRRAGGRAFLAVAVAGLATQVIKHTLGLPRPRMWEISAGNLGPSFLAGLDTFPSGHTATTTALAVVLAAAAPRLKPLLLAWPAAMALARVAVGAHFPSDVAGGALLGAAAGWIIRTTPPNAVGATLRRLFWSLRGRLSFSFLAGVVILFTSRPFLLAPPPIAFEVPAWLLLVCGQALRFWLRGCRGDGTTGPSPPLSGPYAFVRYPEITAAAMIGLGLSLLTGTPWVLLVFLVLFVTEFGAYYAVEEGVRLAGSASYAERRRRVHAILPRPTVRVSSPPLSGAIPSPEEGTTNRFLIRRAAPEAWNAALLILAAAALEFSEPLHPPLILPGVMPE